MQIVLYEDEQVLEEVVVIGYGTAKKSDLTGSVGQIAAKEVQKRQTVNPVDALAGRIAGVMVNNNSGRLVDKWILILEGSILSMHQMLLCL